MARSNPGAGVYRKHLSVDPATLTHTLVLANGERLHAIIPAHHQFGMILGWANSVGPDDALRFELEHELGTRVHIAMEHEALGMGALFDLQLAEHFDNQAGDP